MDYPEAVKWLRKSAEQGYAPAMCDLGICYENGEGLKQDFKEAARWVRMSAERGWPMGQYQMAFYYYHGAGVPKDMKKADEWNRKAMEQGYPEAFGLAQAIQLELARNKGGPADTSRTRKSP